MWMDEIRKALSIHVLTDTLTGTFIASDSSKDKYWNKQGDIGKLKMSLEESFVKRKNIICLLNQPSTISLIEKYVFTPSPKHLHQKTHTSTKHQRTVNVHIVHHNFFIFVLWKQFLSEGRVKCISVLPQPHPLLL